MAMAASLGRQLVRAGVVHALPVRAGVSVKLASAWRCRSVHSLGSSRSTSRVAGGAAWRKFSVRAIDVSGPGSIDSLISGMESKIKDQLKAQEVIVKDAYGDGRHVSIEVVSEAFEGQSAVNRQRMVYKAIWEELQNAVHAVDQIKTKTPAEAASSKSN